MMKESSTTENQAIIDSIKALHKAEIINIADGKGGNIEVIAYPANDGIQVKSTKTFKDEYLTAPERRKGTAEIKSLQSFIDHVNRFKDGDSALFANPAQSQPSLQCVIDYHKATFEGQPRFGGHRTSYKFPLSKEWLTWNKYNGEAFTQAEFAEFLEDNILDVISPYDDDVATSQRIQDLKNLLGGNFASPQKLVQLSKGLAINEASKVVSTANLASGEVNIVYETAHNDQNGAPIQVPNFFLIAIPVFEMGSPYLMAVRLRYRLGGGSIKWSFQLSGVEKVFDNAFEEACNTAKDATDLPLFVGSPE